MYYSFVLFTFYLFISCASQGAPSGGPVDEDGPKLLSINPKMDLLRANEDIILFFNESINPFSVFEAIEIYFPIFDENDYFIGNNFFYDFTYEIKGKKIIISPLKTWPKENIIKLHISKKIKDYQKNEMSSPIQLSYILNENFNINQAKSYISGKLINYDEKPYEVGLLSIEDISNIKLLEKVETDIDGSFIFSDLNSGKYSILAILDYIDEPTIDIRRRNYGLISLDSIIISDLDTIIGLNIFVDSPIERLSIQSVRPINNYFSQILYSNGKESPFILPTYNSKSESYVQGDTILIKQKLANRLENYDVEPYKFVISDIKDTIPARIESHSVKGDFLYVEFNEPIITQMNGNKISDLNSFTNLVIMDYYDSVYHSISFNTINPLTIEIEIKQIISDRISIHNVTDLSKNLNSDTLYIDIESPKIESSYIGGNIYGVLKYSGDNTIIIRTTNIKTNEEYYFSTKNNNFSLLNLEPGKYMIFAYEQLGDIESNEYFSGTLIPFKRSAKFEVYNNIIEVRPHWDIKDLIITIK